MPKYNHIIWDWNGTLLDDADAALYSVNKLLEKRGLPIISSSEYRNKFRFPVFDYYTELGIDFDKESFPEFIKEYKNNLKDINSKLFDGAMETIKSINALRVEQSILSAASLDEIDIYLRKYKLKKLFVEISTIDERFNSKTTLAREHFRRLGLNPQTTLMIGDTSYDLEIAEKNSCDCLLIPSGHQSYEALKKITNNILADIKDIKEFILKK